MDNKMSENKYVMGIDFGTDSCRSVIIDAMTGQELDSEIFYYPRWKAGKYCVATKQQFRQHPSDHIEGLESVICKPLARQSQVVRDNLKAITVDTTGSTPGPVDKYGQPLALTAEFSENPNAMFMMWKDHTSIEETDAINHLAKTWGGIDYTKYSGGLYSSEWFWAKLLHIFKTDPKTGEHIVSFVEHCDWVVAHLTGVKDYKDIKRSRCAAGHKAMWHKEFNGLPSVEFLNKLDPQMGAIRERLYSDTHTAEELAGYLSASWQAKAGLKNPVAIGMGAFDAHIGAVGGGAKPYAFVKVMGTSTCDILTAPPSQIGDKVIEGICGQVDGSVVDGMIGLEAGQSAFGDIYNWFKEVLAWPINNSSLSSEQKEAITSSLLVNLEKEAKLLDVSEVGEIALDYHNGRRTPFANQKLQGIMAGITLGSTAPRLYLSLIEATAFGSKAIVDQMLGAGVRIDEIIAIGGVAKKSPLIMQTLANVLNKPIKVAQSVQTVALGSAIFAAKVAGIYASVDEAQKVLASPFEKEYLPQADKVLHYAAKYKKYEALVRFEEEDKK